MDRNQMKIAGIVCLVVCVICVFVAIERYQANASSVRVMQNLTESTPLGGMVEVKIKPATPAATKYALFFALLSGAGGVYLLLKSGQKQADPIAPAE